MTKTERTIELSNQDEAIKLCGINDAYLRQVRKTFDVRAFIRGNTLKIIGNKQNAFNAFEVFRQTTERIKNRCEVTPDEVSEIMKKVSNPEYRGKLKEEEISSLSRVVPRSEGQRRYVEALETDDIVFSIGPAGTGKTYLAVAHALKCLRSNMVRKIVLARPAVEAGERLGFLPGDYQEKVNPYLRPLYDALNHFLSYPQLKRLMDTEIIEVIALAYMRGRNLDNAFMILDEGQNTTSEQMKMFLTRMGEGSKIVVTGDITQIDLPIGKVSGLVEVQSVLGHVKGIAFSYLTRADIVRHHLVQSIVDAYETKRDHSKKQR